MYFADPNTGDDANKVLGNPAEAICVLAHDANVTYNHTGKKYKKDLYFELKEGCIIIDPWRNFKNNHYKIIYYGDK